MFISVEHRCMCFWWSFHGNKHKSSVDCVQFLATAMEMVWIFSYLISPFPSAIYVVFLDIWNHYYMSPNSSAWYRPCSVKWDNQNAIFKTKSSPTFPSNSLRQPQSLSESRRGSENLQSIFRPRALRYWNGFSCKINLSAFPSKRLGMVGVSL